MTPVWWILATQGPVVETRTGEPLPTVFCGVRFAALVVNTPMPVPDAEHVHVYDIQEVLVVGAGVTEVPARLVASEGTSGRRVLLGGLDGPLGYSWEVRRRTLSVQGEVYAVQDEEVWKSTVVRSRGAHQTVVIERFTDMDVVIADVRRLAPRLQDARKRWRYCARHGYPVGERPPRGVDLAPPTPAGELGGP